jgi:hypothetical protein
MTLPQEMIDRIVAGVLEQLRQPADAATRSSPSPNAEEQANGVEKSLTPPPAKTSLEIRDDVITAALLEERGVYAGPITIGVKSVLTPSAHDFLARRKIEWNRVLTNGAASTPSSKWLAIVTRSTPAVAAALDTVVQAAGSKWSRELAGCHREAAIRAISALCRGECDAVIIFTGKPEAAVCRANRNPNVRGAAVTTVARIKPLSQQLGANLFALDPSERTAFELRNLLRVLGSTGKPAVPPDWNE